MKTPKTIAGWCTVLFFLFYGINAFFAMSFFPMLIGIFALGAAVFTFIGKYDRCFLARTTGQTPVVCI